MTEQLHLALPTGRRRRWRRVLWEPGIPLYDVPPPEVDLGQPRRRCWCSLPPEQLEPRDGAMRWRPTGR